MTASPGRILVVDDEPVVRENLRIGLEYEGYAVALAEDGVDALAQAGAAAPDLVIMDVMMPRMDGATAWSFDRLRLWLERGTPPERSLRRALMEVALRVLIAASAVIAAVITSTPASHSTAVAAVRLGLALAIPAPLLLPPLPGTPAARRCVRRRPAPVTAPAILDRLKALT